MPLLAPAALVRHNRLDRVLAECVGLEVAETTALVENLGELKLARGEAHNVLQFDSLAILDLETAEVDNEEFWLT